MQTSILTEIQKNKASKVFELGQIKVKLFLDAKQLDSDWDKIADQKTIFLSSKYLKVLEEFPPLGMKFCYCTLYFNDQPVGISYYQIQFFNAHQSLNDTERVENPCFFTTIHKFIKGFVSKKVEFNTLVNGNLLLTGENGFYFTDRFKSQNNIADIMMPLNNQVRSILSDKGMKCQVILAKDFYPENHSVINELKQNGEYHPFTLQPSMIMPIQTNWLTFDDYMNDLHSKYRIRAKRAFKKNESLEHKWLSDDEIEKYQNEFHSMYSEIAENAGFNVVNLNEAYLSGLKKYLGKDYKVKAYFLNNELVGYFTLILDGKNLEAHFLGYKKKVNNETQLYLNMLFEMISTAIELRMENLILSRTALEIKSSVGAVPIEMLCGMRLYNSFSNTFFKPLLDFLKPNTEWVQRHPFK